MVQKKQLKRMLLGGVLVGAFACSSLTAFGAIAEITGSTSDSSYQSGAGVSGDPMIFEFPTSNFILEEDNSSATSDAGAVIAQLTTNIEAILQGYDVLTVVAKAGNNTDATALADVDTRAVSVGFEIQDGSFTADRALILNVNATAGNADATGSGQNANASALTGGFNVTAPTATMIVDGNTTVNLNARSADATSDTIAQSKVVSYGIKSAGNTTINGTFNVNSTVTTGDANGAVANTNVEVYGANNVGTGTISVTDDFTFENTTTGGNATATAGNSESFIKVDVIRTQNGPVTIGGNVDARTTVTGGSATGSAKADSRVEVGTFVGWLNGNIDVTGNVNSSIKATGGNAASTSGGIADANMQIVTAAIYENSNLTISGDLVSNTTVTGGTATSSGTAKADVTTGGLFAGWMTNTATITVDGNTTIDAVAIGGTANGADGEAYAFGAAALNGTIDLNGDVVITTSATKASGAAGITDALGAVNGTVNVNQAGGKKVQLTGDISVRTAQLTPAINGKINVKLDTSDSFLKGLVNNDGGANETNVSFSNGATWAPTGDGIAGVIASDFGTAGTGLTLDNGGVLDMAAWKLDANGVNTTNSYRTLNIAGNATLNDGSVFRINSDLANDKADLINFTGTATPTGTQYVQIGYDPTVAAQLDAGTTTITPTTQLNIITGVGSAAVDGKVSQIDGALFRHDVTPTVNNDGSGNITLDSISNVTTKKSLSEAPMTAADAQQAGQNAWMNQGNHMVRRLGDLRLEGGDAQNGIWTRIYTGSNRVKSGSYDRKFDQDFTGMQLGYDRKFESKNGHYYLGGLFDYQTSDPSFMRGDGNVDAYGLGLYGSWVSDKGHHVDVVLRGSQVKNDYSVLDINNNKISADYNLMSYGISMEYGYRKDLKKNFFVEPQAQLNLGYMGSGHHTLSNGVEISQDSVTTATGRLGILLGKEFGKDEKKGNFYFQTSLIQDFSETPEMFATNNGQRVKIDAIDTKGTSFEFALGTNYKFNNKGKLYLELSKTVGGEIDTRWMLNGGVRFNF